MPHWLSNWIENQKRTRRFHPSWIVLVAVVTIIVAGMIWIAAELVAKAEQRDRPPAAELPAPGKTEAPAEEVPGDVRGPTQRRNIGIV